jgi:hypothetical protein
MKVFRTLLTVAAVCGLTLSAYTAYGDDFRANVLDPPSVPAAQSGYKVHIIKSTDFNINFTKCKPGELPLGLTANGCFAGANDSGETWTSLEMTFLGNGATAGQTPNCQPAQGTDTLTIYTSTVCTVLDGNFSLSFSDGSIPSGDGVSSIFYVTETGVKPPRDFPTGNVVAGFETPEPASFPLLLTGTVLLGFLSTPKLRRRMHRQNWT